MNAKPEKHRVAAIMLAWPGHKFLVTCKNTSVGQSRRAFDELIEFPVIVKKDHTEVWREVEKTIAAAAPIDKMQYAIFFERSPMFGGERTIPADFQHGDFARSILDMCQYAGEGEYAPWINSLSSQKHRQEAADALKQFRENHEIIVIKE